MSFIVLPDWLLKIYLDKYKGVILEIKTILTEALIVKHAQEADINITPISKYYIQKDNYKENGKVRVLISYKGIPTEDIEPAIKLLGYVLGK